MHCRYPYSAYLPVRCLLDLRVSVSSDLIAEQLTQDDAIGVRTPLEEVSQNI